MSADSNMAPDNAMWNPPIKLPYLIHFCSKVQLVVRFWPNEAMSAHTPHLHHTLYSSDYTVQTCLCEVRKFGQKLVCAKFASLDNKIVESINDQSQYQQRI